MLSKKSTLQLSAEEFDRIAELSMICFSDEEKTEIAQDMQTIVSFASKLSELDADALDTEYGKEIIAVTREDKSSVDISRNELLAMSESVYDGYVCVPKVIGDVE